MQEKIKLTGNHRKLLYSTVALLWLTGIFWLYFHYFGETKNQFGPAKSPWEATMLTAHGVFAYAMLVVLGTMIGHVLRGLSIKRNKVSGIFILVVFSLLAITGLLLYYSGSDFWREAASYTHWIVGFMLPFLLALHIWSGRKRARTEK